MRVLPVIVIQILSVAIIVTTVTPGNTIVSKSIQQRSLIELLASKEASTNIGFTFLTSHNGYHLYKLEQRSGSTPAQLSTANRILEQFLQESFDTPGRSYFNVAQWCGTTILAFLTEKAPLSLSNISALLLARSQAFDNSMYVCFLSVLKQHRQHGLGTKLLNQLIKEAIGTKTARVTLHVNPENTGAMSLYLKCGMRCIDFVRGYYFVDQTYASQDALAMSLQLANVKNSSVVCQSVAAVNIYPQEEALYKQRCPQAASG